MATEGFHEYDVSRFWVYELLARYRVEGEAAFISCSQTTSHHTDRHACRSRWADWPRSSTRPSSPHRPFSPPDQTCHLLVQQSQGARCMADMRW